MQPARGKRRVLSNVEALKDASSLKKGSEVVVLDRKRVMAAFREEHLPWNWACELLVGEKGFVHEIVKHEDEDSKATPLILFPDNPVLGELCDKDRAW